MLDSVRAKARLRRFIKGWVTYRDLVLDCLGKRETTAEQEQRFLKLQARLASQVPWLTSVVPPNLGQEAQRQLTQVTELLSRYRSLRAESLTGQREREEFEREWHEGFIFLNKLTGVQLPGSKQPAKRLGAGVPRGLSQHTRRQRGPVVRFLGFLLRVAVVFVAIYLVARGLGLRWTAEGRFTPVLPESFIGWWSGVQGGLGDIWGRIAFFAQPLIAVYGPTVTIILFAVLLFAIFYWAFLRG